MYSHCSTGAELIKMHKTCHSLAACSQAHIYVSKQRKVPCGCDGDTKSKGGRLNCSVRKYILFNKGKVSWAKKAKCDSGFDHMLVVQILGCCCTSYSPLILWAQMELVQIWEHLQVCPESGDGPQHHEQQVFSASGNGKVGPKQCRH